MIRRFWNWLMGEHIRVTGDFPPRQYWEKYPNWENALDEEEVDGQDETTLRPCRVQNYIDENATFTVGEVISGDGSKFEAMLRIVWGRIDEVNAFADNQGKWCIFYSNPQRKWLTCVYEHMPKIVEVNEPRIFPLVVKSRLPNEPDGKPIHFRINSDGTMEYLN